MKPAMLAGRGSAADRFAPLVPSKDGGGSVKRFHPTQPDRQSRGLGLSSLMSPTPQPTDAAIPNPALMRRKHGAQPAGDTDAMID